MLLSFLLNLTYLKSLLPLNHSSYWQEGMETWEPGALPAQLSHPLSPQLAGTSLLGSRSWQPGGPDPAVLCWPILRVSLPGGRDTFQPAAKEHLTLKVSSDLWIRKGLVSTV